MTPSKTILFFGNERLATGVTTDTPIIKALVSNGYKVVAVVNPSLRSNNPSRKVRKSEIAEQATKFNIPLLEFEQLSSALPQLKSLNAQAGILAAYGKIVPQAVIDLFEFGIINVHPSLLPLHRGPTPIESVMLAGESQTGVSLMQLVSTMDAGPIYDQVSLKLTGKEEKQQLADRLGKLGAERLITVLPQIFAGTLKPLAQSGSVSYDKRLEAALGHLDLNMPAIALERAIRAFKGWPRSRITINSQPVIITAAHVISGEQEVPGQIKLVAGSLAFTTAQDLLVIDRLIPAGGKEMSSKAYLQGRPL